jgi:hypothetical protein
MRIAATAVSKNAGRETEQHGSTSLFFYAWYSIIGNP